MTSRWKAFSLSAVLAAAFTLPAAAEEPAPDTSKLTDSQKLQLIQTQLVDIQKSLADLKAIRRELENLKDTQAGIDADLNTTKKNVARQTEQIKMLEDNVGQLQKQMDDLRREMNDVRTQMSTVTQSQSLKPATPPPTGRIRLRNTFYEPVSIVVNNKSYRLDPGEVYVLDQQPAGEFTYEVLGIEPRTTRSLAPNQTFNIRVFTRY